MFKILYSYYCSNKGNPVEIIKEQLETIYSITADRIEIAGSVVTGYGEELIRKAFNIDEGLVETLAHYTAAKHFNPNVDYILDIGGQDIKCFKISNIDWVFTFCNTSYICLIIYNIMIIRNSCG